MDRKEARLVANLIGISFLLLLYSWLQPSFFQVVIGIAVYAGMQFQFIHQDREAERAKNEELKRSAENEETGHTETIAEEEGTVLREEEKEK